MRCFLACFCSSKHKKHQLLMNVSPSKGNRDGVNEALQLDVATKQEVIQEPIINPVKEPEEKPEQQLSNNGETKVAFDLNAKVDYETLSAEEAANNYVMENNGKENSENKEETEEEPSNTSKSISNLIYPPNHRYRDYTNEECEDLDLQDGGSQILAQEESSESLFSLSIDSRKQVCETEVGEKEVSSPMPKYVSSQEGQKAIGPNRNGQGRNRNVDSVLSPVENLPQWKAVKARAALPVHPQDKENINEAQDLVISNSSEPSFKLLTKTNVNKEKHLDQEIAVDTSLSSWLVEPATTPLSKGSANSVGNSPSQRISSPRSHDGRPILGELTSNELKQVSDSTSPRRGRSKTPETPVIGTIGSYWSHTGQTMDSDSGSSSSKGNSNTSRKNGEDERWKWNSTPCEARLDSAMDRIIA